jgi:hypothetical protein
MSLLDTQQTETAVYLQLISIMHDDPISLSGRAVKDTRQKSVGGSGGVDTGGELIGGHRLAEKKI